MKCLHVATKNLEDFVWCLELELQDFKELESFTELYDSWAYDMLWSTLMYSDSEFHYFDFSVSRYLKDPREVR